jgi:hypothetical protein
MEELLRKWTQTKHIDVTPLKSVQRKTASVAAQRFLTMPETEKHLTPSVASLEVNDRRELSTVKPGRCYGMQVPPLEGKASGKDVLKYMVAPLGLGKFHACMDACPVHVARPNNPGIFDGWFGKAEIDDLLRTKGLQYTLNLNVTK